MTNVLEQQSTSPFNGLRNRNVIENRNRFDGEINVYSAIQCCKRN